MGTRSQVPVRVMLVDDHEMVLEGLQAVLLGFPDRVRVVGCVLGIGDAASMAAELKPDIVLCDVRMRGGGGLDLCRSLRRRSATRKVVMLSVYDDDEYVSDSLGAGAAGYLLKSIGGEELVHQLEIIHGGATVVDEGIAARCANTTPSRRAQTWPGARHGLTQRESEVLSYVVAGVSNYGIATRLVIGHETVRTHIRSLYRKLGVRDRSSAVAAAMRDGFLT
jgi:DNA-binding NarL/FixJ family response regulator